MAGEEEDDVKSIHSHRIKMEISGHSLEESMEECRVEEMSVHKVRYRWTGGTLDLNDGFRWVWLPTLWSVVDPHPSRLISLQPQLGRSLIITKNVCLHSPTIKIHYRMVFRIRTWSWTRLSLTTGTPSWSLVPAPVTRAAPRAPCVLYRNAPMAPAQKVADAIVCN